PGRGCTMSVAAVFASHTPLKDYYSPGRAIEREVDDCLRAVRAFVADFAPELVIAVGPDHFNGFFYRLMPSFCIGTAATSVGDWNTPAGPLPVAAALAEDCARAVHAAGVDIALSHHMEVDHGITQLLNQIFDWAALPPLLPIFVNCAAPPLPPLARVQALGAALGAFARDYPGRVLFAASGGLSHDPPIPGLADAAPPVRERLVMGGVLSPAARAARQERVLTEATNQVAGTSTRLAPDAAWDEAFLAHLEARDFAALLGLDDEAISRQAGCGGHEIRSWLAVAAAADAAGCGAFERRYYRAIPEWITGYGVMTAAPSTALT
ncbi:MAG: 3-carboxyethylcatechol 2,3-dioxygenase, partial [Gammaproteobacteria bacterium]